MRQPVRQHPLTLEGGTTIHPDLGWPDVGFFVEVDHLSWHGGRLENAYDRWRDRQVRLIGKELVRVTDIDLDCRPADAVHDVLRLYALHCGR